MTSILSRYVGLLFLQAWMLFTGGLLTLTIIIDFAVQVGHFMDARINDKLHFIGLYYAHKIPFMLPYLPSLSLLLAASFTLVRLGRANELVPMMMAGRSLRRVCLPFFLAALATGLGTGLLEEVVLPAAGPNMTLLEERLYRIEGTIAMTARSPRGDQLFAQTFNWATLSGRGIQLTLMDEGGLIRREITAETAEWIKEQECWVLSDGTVQEFEKGRRKTLLLPDGKEVLDRFAFGPRGLQVPVRIEPTRFATFDYYAGFRTIGTTRNLMRQYPEISGYRAEYLGRFVAPLGPLVLTMLCLPLIAPLRRRGSAFVGGALCFLLIAAYFGAVLLAGALGRRALIPVEVSVFGPLALFGAAGAVAIFRMRT